MTNAMDRLYGQVADKGHVCLGLDTDYTYLPEDFAQDFSSKGEAVLAFNKAIVDQTLDVAAVYKVQIAYYEAMGLEGLGAYSETLKYLRKKGALVIADVKRGDIAKTAEMYAQAHFTGDFEADIITVNPYMGMDTITPFFPYLEKGKGIFALVATSNPGAMDIEGITHEGKKVYEMVGEMLQKLGERFMGRCGYSAIGGVVGCTDPQATIGIRRALDKTFFLIPGYGAQGGTAQDMGRYLRDGNGGVVNSSRGVLLAYRKDAFRGMRFDGAARAECIRMRDDIHSALKGE